MNKLLYPWIFFGFSCFLAFFGIRQFVNSGTNRQNPGGNVHEENIQPDHPSTSDAVHNRIPGSDIHGKTALPLYVDPQIVFEEYVIPFFHQTENPAILFINTIHADAGQILATVPFSGEFAGSFQEPTNMTGWDFSILSLIGQIEESGDRFLSIDELLSNGGKQAKDYFVSFVHIPPDRKENPGPSGFIRQANDIFTNDVMGILSTVQSSLLYVSDLFNRYITGNEWFRDETEISSLTGKAGDCVRP